jgi:hypothetical protein
MKWGRGGAAGHRLSGGVYEIRSCLILPSAGVLDRSPSGRNQEVLRAFPLCFPRSPPRRCWAGGAARSFKKFLAASPAAAAARGLSAALAGGRAGRTVAQPGARPGPWEPQASERGAGSAGRGACGSRHGHPGAACWPPFSPPTRGEHPHPPALPPRLLTCSLESFPSWKRETERQN